MRAVDLIHRKREGQALTPAEIDWLIAQYVQGAIPDYQAAAWLMAVFFNGLTAAELQALTRAMMHSGEVFDWSDLPGPKVDKHSTGGVGDKVSIILAPLVAACGVIVPMVSGRGLGHTGGTLDKLEAISGFQVHLDKSRVRHLLKTIGVAMVGQTDRFVPADKKLYALRDVTATVESIPLIAASIMSKKLAEGCEGLVLDIKVGNGAFLPEPERARQLARTMIGLGRAMGRKVSAVVTSMDQPTGHAIGNACEIQEAIAVMRGERPADLMAITLALAGRMLVLAGCARTQAKAVEMLEHALNKGDALEVFRRMIEAQGGDPRVVDNPRLMKLAPREAVVAAPRSGWLAAFETRTIGLAACRLGAGRQTKEDRIDPSVALWVQAKLGDRIEAGQPVFTVRYRNQTAWEAVRPELEKTFRIAEAPVTPPSAVLEQIR